MLFLLMCLNISREAKIIHFDMSLLAKSPAKPGGPVFSIVIECHTVTPRWILPELISWIVSLLVQQQLVRASQCSRVIVLSQQMVIL